MGGAAEQNAGASDRGSEQRDTSRAADAWQRVEAEKPDRDAARKAWDASHDPSPEFTQAARPLGNEFGRDRPAQRELTPEQRAELEEAFDRPADELLALREQDPRAGHNRDEQGRILDHHGQPRTELSPAEAEQEAERQAREYGPGTDWHAEHIEQHDQTDQTEQADQPEGTEQPEQSGQAERTEQTEQAGQLEQSEQSELSEPSEQSQQTEQTQQPETVAQVSDSEATSDSDPTASDDQRPSNPELSPDLQAPSEHPDEQDDTDTTETTESAEPAQDAEPDGDPEADEPDDTDQSTGADTPNGAEPLQGTEPQDSSEGIGEGMGPPHGDTPLSVPADAAGADDGEPADSPHDSAESGVQADRSEISRIVDGLRNGELTREQAADELEAYQDSNEPPADRIETTTETIRVEHTAQGDLFYQRESPIEDPDRPGERTTNEESDKVSRRRRNTDELGRGSQLIPKVKDMVDDGQAALPRLAPGTHGETSIRQPDVPTVESRSPDNLDAGNMLAASLAVLTVGVIASQRIGEKVRSKRNRQEE